jgi:hypothetical protein
VVETAGAGRAVVKEVVVRAGVMVAGVTEVVRAAEAMVAATAVEDLVAAREEAGKAVGWEVEELVVG